MSRQSAEDWSGDRIGILGGTFDPPHTGHVRMAAAARDVLGLARVFFSPAPHPPHKDGAEVVVWEHRRAMTAAALGGEAGMAVTDIERSDTPSYTVDLLRAAAERTRAELYFIMGADSLARLASWREPAEVLRLCTLVVFPRGEHRMCLPVTGAAALVVFESPRVDVSSAEVRAALESGAPAGSGALSPAVAAYIAQNRLYRRS
jgi:nicotinate-nucleotide adenylyltransferase